MNNRPLLILAIVVLAIVGGTFWFLNSSQPGPLPESTAPEVKTDVAPAPKTPDRPERDPSLQAPDPAPKTATSPKATPRPLEGWELKIDEVLRSNADEAQTAQILINMLPTLPPEGQAEAAQHISNLILDQDYAKVMPLVKNPNLPEEVLDVFVTDLMNRDDSTKLPALLEIAKIPNHPHHEEALTDLQIFLDEDYGNDWSRWDAATKAYIKKQAEEEAASDSDSEKPKAKK